MDAEASKAVAKHDLAKDVGEQLLLRFGLLESIGRVNETDA
jgi:hypothetical protein